MFKRKFDKIYKYDIGIIITAKLSIHMRIVVYVYKINTFIYM